MLAGGFQATAPTDPVRGCVCSRTTRPGRKSSSSRCVAALLPFRCLNIDSPLVRSLCCSLPSSLPDKRLSLNSPGNFCTQVLKVAQAELKSLKPGRVRTHRHPGNESGPPPRLAVPLSAPDGACEPAARHAGTADTEAAFFCSGGVPAARQCADAQLARRCTRHRGREARGAGVQVKRPRARRRRCHPRRRSRTPRRHPSPSCRCVPGARSHLTHTADSSAHATVWPPRAHHRSPHAPAARLGFRRTVHSSRYAGPLVLGRRKTPSPARTTSATKPLTRPASPTREREYPRQPPPHACVMIPFFGLPWRQLGS
jgi:hypothetical protein